LSDGDKAISSKIKGLSGNKAHQDEDIHYLQKAEIEKWEGTPKKKAGQLVFLESFPNKWINKTKRWPGKNYICGWGSPRKNFNQRCGGNSLNFNVGSGGEGTTREFLTGTQGVCPGQKQGAHVTTKRLCQAGRGSWPWG